MKLAVTLLGLALILTTPEVQSQEASRKAGSEEKKLQAMTGDWKLTCQYAASLFGPAGQGTETSSGRMILDGMCLEESGTMFKDDKFKALTTYNPKIGKYDSYFVATSGFAQLSPLTIEGNIWSTSWTEEKDGKTIKCRSVKTLSEDGRTFVEKWEYLDGEKWLLWREVKGVKTKKSK